ncbi:MAG: O-antigen ligase family protein [Limisphaerales bacterium]
MEQTRPRIAPVPGRRAVIDVSQVYQFLDTASEYLIYFAVIFGPWAFGTTQVWSIKIMNWVGYLLGGCFLLKVLIRHSSVYYPKRWTEIFIYSRKNRGYSAVYFDVALGILTVLILGYCFISAVNARAVYRPEYWRLDYKESIMWLPHSYDADQSWFYFWMYLGLAGLFWGIKDWLITIPHGEEGLAAEIADGADRRSILPPVRMRRLFYVLAINGALLAAEGIIQRVVGTNKLLWLVEPRINNFAEAQFGPYAYRSNAAQYFNLLWPSVLGFWWACASVTRRRAGYARISGFYTSKTFNLLLPCVLLMAICPIVSTSRGGAIVMAGLAVYSVIVLLLARWRAWWGAKLVVILIVGGSILSGLLLGWEELAPRLEMIEEGYKAREFMFGAGRQMAQDNPVFGTGPGTFNSLFQFYRRFPNEYWPAQLHNDWLETLITFGAVGMTLILMAFLTVILKWFFPGGIYGEKHFVILIWGALAGCFVHARFDFPFQIHSILALFLVLCAVLFCLTRRSKEG